MGYLARPAEQCHGVPEHNNAHAFMKPHTWGQPGYDNLSELSANFLAWILGWIVCCSGMVLQDWWLCRRERTVVQNYSGFQAPESLHRTVWDHLKILQLGDSCMLCAQPASSQKLWKQQTRIWNSAFKILELLQQMNACIAKHKFLHRSDQDICIWVRGNNCVRNCRRDESVQPLRFISVCSVIWNCASCSLVLWQWKLCKA